MLYCGYNEVMKCISRFSEVNHLPSVHHYHSLQTCGLPAVKYVIYQNVLSISAFKTFWKQCHRRHISYGSFIHFFTIWWECRVWSTLWCLYLLSSTSPPPVFLTRIPLGTLLCCDVESTSLKLIHRRNNVVCLVGDVLAVGAHFFGNSSLLFQFVQRGGCIDDGINGAREPLTVTSQCLAWWCSNTSHSCAWMRQRLQEAAEWRAAASCPMSSAAAACKRLQRPVPLI